MDNTKTTSDVVPVSTVSQNAAATVPAQTTATSSLTPELENLLSELVTNYRTGENVSGATVKRREETETGSESKKQKSYTQQSETTTAEATAAEATDGVTKLRGLVDQWKTDAEEQTSASIDNATNQAISELTQAEEDANEQYQEMSRQVDAEEAKALDNQALYAEARGDRGGVGAQQYNSIMNTAAQNRLTVMQQQMQMSTEMARQISDLRARGEYEKADAVLNISQSYLTELMSMEEWAAAYQLSVKQFEYQVNTWRIEFLTSVAQTVKGAYDSYTADRASGVESAVDDAVNIVVDERNSQDVEYSEPTNTTAYSLDELLEMFANGRTKSQVEETLLKKRGVDYTDAAVQSDIKWAMSK